LSDVKADDSGRTIKMRSIRMKAQRTADTKARQKQRWAVRSVCG
jgi:hypothetical protein